MLKTLAFDPDKWTDTKLNHGIDDILTDVSKSLDDELLFIEHSDDGKKPACVEIGESRLPSGSSASGKSDATLSTIAHDGVYTVRRKNALHPSFATCEDEYHDDDDPGFRVREIFEADLIREMSIQ